MLPSRTALSSTRTNQLTVYTTTANNSDHLFSNLPLHSLAYCRLSYSPDSQSTSNYFWIFYPLLLLLQLAYPPKHAEDFLSRPNPLQITSESSTLFLSSHYFTGILRFLLMFSYPPKCKPLLFNSLPFSSCSSTSLSSEAYYCLSYLSLYS